MFEIVAHIPLDLMLNRKISLKNIILREKNNNLLSSKRIGSGAKKQDKNSESSHGGSCFVRATGDVFLC